MLYTSCRANGEIKIQIDIIRSELNFFPKFCETDEYLKSSPNSSHDPQYGTFFYSAIVSNEKNISKSFTELLRGLLLFQVSYESVKCSQDFIYVTFGLKVLFFQFIYPIKQVKMQ